MVELGSIDTKNLTSAERKRIKKLMRTVNDEPEGSVGCTSVINGILRQAQARSLDRADHKQSKPPATCRVRANHFSASGAI